jgi:hypothetical protein
VAREPALKSFPANLVPLLASVIGNDTIADPSLLLGLQQHCVQKHGKRTASTAAAARSSKGKKPESGAAAAAAAAAAVLHASRTARDLPVLPAICQFLLSITAPVPGDSDSSKENAVESALEAIEFALQSPASSSSPAAAPFEPLTPKAAASTPKAAASTPKSVRREPAAVVSALRQSLQVIAVYCSICSPVELFALH